ncbi:hypothetical protein KY314_05160 [Candidatus Woesearchaeota archaeon]|nr:hypothetical protein [Candidatus Woesearchaeota archaeon]
MTTVYDLDENNEVVQTQINFNKEVNQNMASLKDTAQAYEPPQTLNIADLDKVPTEAEVKSETGKNKDDEEFTYNYIEVEGQRYRVPNSVLTELKTILEEKPDLKEFRVKKTGSGLQTRYTVIPL